MSSAFSRRGCTSRTPDDSEAGDSVTSSNSTGTGRLGVSDRGLALSAVSPLPRLQISVLLFLQLAEPIQTHTIYPFISQLVSTLDITGGDPRKVGYYVGIIESTFFVCESAAILQWGRLSDYVGRKPVLLIGVIGLCLSTISFGLSRTFWALVVSRSLAGLLCGNAGVRKSMLSELTDSTNIGQAAALMPITWSVGATIGPFIGGTLARPYDHWPKLFHSPFWQRYPYFLPCVIAATFSAVAFIVAYLFLIETIHQRERSTSRARVEIGDHLETEALLAPTPAPSEDPVALTSLFIHPVLLSIANYAFFAILGSATDALQSVFYAVPIELGGLGLPPAMIGICLSVYGLLNGLFQALFFARIVRRWGLRRAFISGVLAFIPIFAMFPIINTLARWWGLSPFVWAALAVQLTIGVAMDMSYSCIFIYISSAAPNKRSLGATNGLAQTAVAVARAIGPASSTSLLSLSVQHDWMGGYAVYAVFIVLVFCVLGVAVQLPEESWKEEQG